VIQTYWMLMVHMGVQIGTFVPKCL